MTTRSFNGTTDRLDQSIGGLSGFTFGTVGGIFSRSAAGAFQTWMGLHESGGTEHSVWQCTSGNQFNWFNGSTAVTAVSTVTNIFMGVVIRKATGTVAPRMSMYNFATGVWTHANATTVANGTAPGAGGRIGVDVGTSEPFAGLLATRSIWNNTLPWTADASGDALIEASGLECLLKNWIDNSPTSAWRFDQAAVTDPADDLVGTADESGRTGTTVSSTVPAGFVFSETAPTVPYRMAKRGHTQDITSATSTVVDLPNAGSIAVGSLLVARLSLDNSGTSGAATTVSVTDPRSNTWTVGAAANRTLGVANDGVSCRIAYCVVQNAYTDGDDITFNYGNATIANSICIDEWRNINTTTPVAVAQVTATGSSTTPSVTISPTAADQVALFALAYEGPAADTYTQDADTTNGIWVALNSIATTSGTAASNASLRGAYKLVTASGSQTWGPTITSRDWAAVGIVFDVASSVTDLVVADASQGQTADNVALTQDHNLAVQDAEQGQTADNVSLTQVHQLVVDDCQQGQTADNVALSQVHALTVQDASQDQTADNVTLTQLHLLAVDDAEQSQTADTPTLGATIDLVVQDASQGQTADTLTLAQVHILAVNDASQEQTADTVSISTEGQLGINDAEQGQTADTVALTQLHILAVDDASQGQTADTPTITQFIHLVISDASQGQTADTPTLVQNSTLVVDDASQGQTADTVTFAGFQPPEVVGTVIVKGLTGTAVTQALGGTAATMTLAGTVEVT